MTFMISVLLQGVIRMIRALDGNGVYYARINRTWL
jgi:hypothetical protein